ncbi:hypothetical protein Zm00014a_037611 [Zea mays]|uniref:Uncharacterized protein n=1 Tax=Zea mays TaxID=4577 RepID=A0A3L6FTB5_MAIZE|nr:hypothetical protein Zm00014a_037611 [Zea mays]
MTMLTLRRLVKKFRQAVIREFIRACHLGLLDDDCVGFAIQSAIMQMSADGFTVVWLPTLRRTARCEPPRRGPMPRRARAPPVAVIPSSSTLVEATPTSNPYPPGYCPVHGYEQCALRDAGILNTTIISDLRQATAAATSTVPPTLTPAEEERPWWRPPTPALPGFGRRPTMAARTGCLPFFSNAVVNSPRLPRSRCRPPRYSRHDAIPEWRLRAAQVYVPPRMRVQ